MARLVVLASQHPRFGKAGIMSDDFLLDAARPLDKIVFFAFDEARQKLEQGAYVEPFTVVLANDGLFIEGHPGDDVEECYESARRSLSDKDLIAEAYVFCYDGYVETDSDTRDAIIVERASRDDAAGEAFALLYAVQDGAEAGAEADAEAGAATGADDETGAGAEKGADDGSQGIDASSDEPPRVKVEYEESIYALGEVETLFGAVGSPGQDGDDAGGEMDEDVDEELESLLEDDQAENDE
jgi:hypothetical protein